MMRLIGGPWNKKIIHDNGLDVQIMTLYSEFDDNGMPRSGGKHGYAIYEPNEERTHTFWLNNVWEPDLELK